MTTSIFSEEHLLKISGVVKSFPGTVAVNKVDFVCKKGEIHGLVGENGAGKSTLMKILAGVHRPDKGQILISNKERTFRNYSEARKAGVGIVYQELSLLPDLSIAENIYMGIWLKRGRFIDWEEIKKKSKIILHEIGIDINPDELVSALPMAIRQMVEIAKVLTQNPEIIIFDEPTAALSIEEVNRMFKILKDLKEKGKAIIFISHRLKEVLDISDVITVMKDGQVVITEKTDYFNEDKLISVMVGREFSEIFPSKTNKISKEEKIFSFQGILKKSKKRVAFILSKGEVLGIGGLQGQGQIDLLQSIFGLGGCTGIKMTVFNKKIEVRNPVQAIRAGISLIPENRNEEGIFLLLSILQNIAASTIDRRQSWGLVKRKRERGVVENISSDLSIKLVSFDQMAQSLSGGNLQKLVLAKWLLVDPKVIVMLEPTKGVDVGTKQEIYRLIRRLAKKGVAIIVYSSEMLELVGLCDRVLIMNHGFFTASLERKKITEENIMKASVSNINLLAGIK